MTGEGAPVTRGVCAFTRRDALACLVAVGAVGVLPVLSGFSAKRKRLIPPASAISASYFGMHIHRVGRTQPWLKHGDTLTAWPSPKFGGWRLWDAYVSWPYLEPQRGQWDFRLMDQYVSMAQSAGVDVLLPLGLTPPWASARPREESSYSPGNAAEPRDIEDWRNYVRSVAQRYKGRIRNYELWNEPNLPGFFSGRPEDMVVLAREAYRILKSVDPENRLVAPATTGDKESLAWLDRYLALGGGYYLDILSHHFYVAQTQPEAMLPYIERVRDVAARYGLSNIPLWNTESGWWIENSHGSNTKSGIGTGWKLLGSSEAPAYVSRALILGWAAGLERYYWYSWDHGEMGLIEPATKAPKSAGRAYALTLEWLLGSVMAECEVSDGVCICSLRNKFGRETHIVWLAVGGPRRWTPPDTWFFTTAETLDGKQLSVVDHRQGLEITQTPIRFF